MYYIVTTVTVVTLALPTALSYDGSRQHLRWLLLLPSPHTSRQAKRSSPLAARGNRAKSQPKSSCIYIQARSRKRPPMQQAQRPTRAAPARGLRLPGRRPLSLHRQALVQTTLTPQRCPDVASISRTLRSENPRAPARNAARALPDPSRPTRQTAKPCQQHKHYRLTSSFSLVWCVRPFPFL
jgi:hypothetical protein